MSITCFDITSDPLPPPGDVFGLGMNYIGIKDICYPTYDGLEMQLDIAIPKNLGKAPFPLVVYYHPGGFFEGSKEDEWARPKIKALVRKYLKARIAFANVRYRLLEETGSESDGLKKPLFDCVGALQWLRHHAVALKINPDKVTLQGGSAGASAAIWIGTHPDMKIAGPPSDYRTRSTRVTAIVAMQTQSTLDARRWPTDVFNSLGFPTDITCIRDILGDIRFRAYYAIDSGVDLSDNDKIDDAIQAYLNIPKNNYKGNGTLKLDMLQLISKNDPPMWIENTKVKVKFPPPLNCTEAKQAQVVHHPLHTRKLYYKLKSIASGPDYFIHTDYPNKDEFRGIDYSGKEIVDFLKDQFGI